MIQVKCDRCGAIAEIPDITEETCSPPKGWRRLYVKLDVYLNDEGTMNTHESEGLHVCPACVKDTKSDAQLDLALNVLRAAGVAAQ